MSREALESLVSAACEAGPVEGIGAEGVREAATAIKTCFGEALKEEREKVGVSSFRFLWLVDVCGGSSCVFGVG